MEEEVVGLGFEGWIEGFHVKTVEGVRRAGVQQECGGQKALCCAEEGSHLSCRVLEGRSL